MTKKLKTFIFDITERKLLFSFMVTLSLLVFNLVVYKPSFETNDDNALSRIISGFCGENDPHMVFVNYVIGLFLKLFYSINQTIPWYELLQLFVCFCSLTAITYFLLNTIKTKYNIVLVFLFDVFVSYELFVKMQFTKTAGIASTAGVLLIVLFTLFKQKSVKSFVGIASGIILATIGFCFRYDMFFACGFLSASTVLVYLVSQNVIDKKMLIKRFLPCSIAVVILLCSVGTAFLVNKNAYSSPEWKEYFRRYEVLSNIYDYHGLNFDNTKLSQSTMNLDEVDKQMLSRWNFADTEFFSTDNLEILSESLADSNKSIYSFAAQMVAILLLNKYIPFVMFVCAFVLYIIRNKIKSKESLILLFVCCSMLVLYMYMYFKGRVFIHRVDCILWFTATIPLIMLINKGKGASLKGHLTVLLCVFMFFQTMHYHDCRLLRRNNSGKLNSREVFSVIANDPEHMYFSTSFGLSFSQAYTIFDDVPVGDGENFYPIGGWTSYAPFELAKLEKFNINNPLSDIINNDSVYIIDDNIDATIAYIRKHYDENAEAILVNEINAYCIYKIVS